jgi:hypothetical protein
MGWSFQMWRKQRTMAEPFQNIGDQGFRLYYSGLKKNLVFKEVGNS